MITVDMTNRANHLLSAGTTYHGASGSAGIADHVLVGVHVPVPQLSLGEIGHGEFPALGGLVQAREQTALLLLLGDAQVELDHHGAVAHEVALESIDVTEPLLPDPFGDELGRQALLRKQVVVDTHHEHLLVV